jgi:hypothetical protein
MIPEGAAAIAGAATATQVSSRSEADTTDRNLLESAN